MFIIGVQDADGVLHVNSLAGDEKVAASGIKRVKIRKSLVRGDGLVTAEAAHLFVIVIFFSIILRDSPRRREIAFFFCGILLTVVTTTTFRLCEQNKVAPA